MKKSILELVLGARHLFLGISEGCDQLISPIRVVFLAESTFFRSILVKSVGISEEKIDFMSDFSSAPF